MSGKPTARLKRFYARRNRPIYAIASPLPEWVEVVFSRLNLPEPPAVTVEPLP
jgi:hypothetical protein